MVTIYSLNITGLTKYVCTYVHAYIRGGSRSRMSHGMLLCTIDHMCVTHSDTFRYSWLSWSAFFGDGDGGQGRQCRGAIAAWILPTPNSFSYSKRNTCHAHLTCTRIWRAAHSLRTGVRQRCACVFLVIMAKRWKKSLYNTSDISLPLLQRSSIQVELLQLVWLAHGPFSVSISQIASWNLWPFVLGLGSGNHSP